MIQRKEVLERIEQISPYYLSSKTIPKPFIGNDIKAILLGADPGTDYKIENEFEFVFGIEEKNKTSEYFRQFEKNLNEIGLRIENLYVQNLIQNYFQLTTSRHLSDWKRCANEWLELLKSELDNIDPNRNIPVLVTAYVILEVLNNKKCLKAEDYYKNNEFVGKLENVLERTLIPFFRGGMHKYDLINWGDYSNKVKMFIQNKA
jgi:hypothetical protein